MLNEEQLVSDYEYNRRDRLRSVIADYLSDAGVTAQYMVDEFKTELNSQLGYYRCKVDKINEAVNLIDSSEGKTYPVSITPDDPSLSYSVDKVGAGNTAAYPTATYYVDGHSDVHVSMADTTSQTYNIDTTMYGEVSIASSEGNPTGYYDHDLAGPYFVETPPTGSTTIDYTNPNPVAVASSELNPTGYYGTPMTDSQPAVGSSEADPEGMYGAGGISPEELQGGDKPQYGRSGNFQNMPPT